MFFLGSQGLFFEESIAILWQTCWFLLDYFKNNSPVQVLEMEKMPKKTCTGAEALIHCIHQQGVEYMFGHPGGAAIPIFDALVDSPIKFILTRHEQGATH